MTGTTPDGMGADRYRERQNMRAAKSAPPNYSHDVIAVDSRGAHLYVAESAWSESEAESLLNRCVERLQDGHINNPNVADFIVQER
jgi:hypothetical protein